MFQDKICHSKLHILERRRMRHCTRGYLFIGIKLWQPGWACWALLGVGASQPHSISTLLTRTCTAPPPFPSPPAGIGSYLSRVITIIRCSISSNFVIACSSEPWLSRYAVPPAASRAKARPSNCSIFQLPNWPVQRLWLFADWAVGLRESRLHLRSKICMDSR
jgi:hypothetical protein